jgi:hypothetical protein
VDASNTTLVFLIATMEASCLHQASARLIVSRFERSADSVR